MKTPQVWAIIPAYNEEKRIGSVISKTKMYIKNVIVVDDGSSDGTGKIAKSKGAILLPHIINLGKGAALKTGCDYAIEQGAKIIVTLDADAQHRPEDIPRFIEKIKSVDMVFGCRGLNDHMPPILRFGNWFITQLTSFLYGVSIPDTQSGFRAFTSDAYQKIRWKSNDYSMESEMIANVGRNKLKYQTLTIETLYPDKYKGTTVLDGVKIVFNLLRWKILRNGW